MRLRAGATVDIAPHGDPAAPVWPDQAVELVVIYEDPYLVAIDKPAGMAAHPLVAGEMGTAANGIVARFPECASASPDPREGGLGHRLDTATSGVLIAARSRLAWNGLRRALGDENCEKRYLCEVWGVPESEGRIAADIGRRGRRGGVVRTDGGGRRPLPAETRWTVLLRGAETALIEARLHSGRPHQVRAHFAKAGFPIVGDDRYGGVRTADATERLAPDRSGVGSRPGLRLHAVSVHLRHPMTGAELLIEAPHPAWALGFASAL
jgi:23S rRNA pseudouridine1911/1915/1917 synthase